MKIKQPILENNNLLLVVSIIILTHSLSFSQQSSQTPSQEYSPLYVSTKGNDTNPGSLEKPLKTIQTAIHKTKRMAATIHVKGGHYTITETIRITPEDSGLRIAAHNHEPVIVSSGVPVENWTRVTHPRPATGRPRMVWKALLPEGMDVLTLYDAGSILQRCTSPKFKAWEVNPNNVGGRSGKKATQSKLYFQPDQIDHVKSFAGAEVFILPRRDWVANYLPIKTVDRAQRLIETACPGTYELSTPPTWTQIELFYCIENVPEFLDEPREWYVDKKENALYLITEDGKKPQGILAPGLNTLMSIAGDLKTGNFVKDVHIEGLTFMHAERMTWAQGRIGIQHDWDVADGEWACIKAQGVRDLRIQNCLFDHSGGNGVRFDNEGWNNTIAHNEFRNLGGSAISFIGYGPGTRDRLHSNTITHNHVHHCATLWWLQAGITVCQSSTNLVANNLIHDMPYNGMAFVGGRSGLFGRKRNSRFIGDGFSYIRWDEIPAEVDEWHEKIGYVSTRDNLIEHNEIHHVVTTLGDGNAIYMSGTGTGNILQKNYIHDIPSLSSAGGLRFDNDTWYCTMRKNVVWNVNGCSIVSKHVNTVENNIMVNSGVRSNLNLSAGPKWGSHIRRNIVVNNKALFESTKNKWMKSGDIFAKGVIQECIITDNLFFVSDDASLGEQVTATLNSHFNASGNIHKNPLFKDLDKGDFNLAENSPALKLGYIPFADYGLTGPVGRNLN